MVNLVEDNEKVDMIHLEHKMMNWEPYLPSHFVTAVDESNNLDNSYFHS